MTQQIINLGATGSGAGGDTARTAFEKIIANFAELYLQKAELASPAFTGNPTAPTPAATDTDTSIATTAFVRAAMGLFGIGAQTISTEVDLDLYKTGGGFVTPSTGLLNLPAGWVQGRHVISVGGGANYTSQLLFGGSVNHGRVAQRAWGGTAWSAWRELFHTGNILGTVSQSGGVPTGAIIERGSNANGEYIKWADGTLECWLRSVTVDCVADTDLDVTWPLPAAFNAVNAAATCTLRSPATTNNFIVHKLQGNHTSAAACTMRVRFSVTQSYLLTFHAIGRWY